MTAFIYYRALNCRWNIFGTGNNTIQFISETEKSKSKAPTTKSTVNNKGHFVKKSFAASLGESRFQFNFPVGEIEKLSLDASNEADIQPAQTLDTASITEQSNKHLSTSSEQPSEEQSNPFIKSKLLTADNSFKFNFSVE